MNGWLVYRVLLSEDDHHHFPFMILPSALHEQFWCSLSGPREEFFPFRNEILIAMAASSIATPFKAPEYFFI